MSSNETTRQHASSGPALPQLAEPSHAERARTLISLTSVGTLSTLSRKHPGFPFGSLMPFALDPAGWPLFLISDMAMHTQNLKADPRCSLFVTQADVDGDPLGAARATLIGLAESVPAHRCLRPTLHGTPRDVPCKTRGQDGVATSFPAGDLHPLQHAGLSRRTAHHRQCNYIDDWITALKSASEE